MIILMCILCGLFLSGALELSAVLTWNLAKIFFCTLCILAVPVLAVVFASIAGSLLSLFPILLLIIIFRILCKKQ